MTKYVEYFKVPIKNTTAKSIKLVEQPNGVGSLEFCIGQEKTIVNAKELYEWLKEHYDGNKQLDERLDDDRQYVCASYLY